VEQLRADLAKAEQEKAKAEREKAKIVEFASRSSGGSRRKSGKIGTNDALRRHCKKVISTQLFRKYKFCTNDVQVAAFTKKILRTLALHKDMTKAQKYSWIENNQALVMQELNKHRSYVTNNLRRDARVWYDSHARKLPTVEDIQRCLERNIDVNDEKQVELYVFWVDKILAHAPGNDHDWKADKRYYATISTAAPQDSPERLFMTASTEAFAALAWENNRQGWLKQFALKDKYPGRTIVHLKNEIQATRDKLEAPPNNHKIPQDPVTKAPMYQFMTGSRIGVIHPDYKGKWTKADCGSQQNGGWLDEGLVRFNELVQIVNDARKTEQAAEVEGSILKILREDQGITADNHAAHLAGKKRKRAQDKADLAQLVNTWEDESDVDSDASEGEGSHDGGDTEGDDAA